MYTGYWIGGLWLTAARVPLVVLRGKPDVEEDADDQSDHDDGG